MFGFLSSEKDLADWMEEYLTTREIEGETMAIYNLGVTSGEKPVNCLLEKYQEDIEKVADNPYDEDPEQLMNYLIKISDSEDKLYFLSHRAGI